MLSLRSLFSELSATVICPQEDRASCNPGMSRRWSGMSFTDLRLGSRFKGMVRACPFHRTMSMWNRPQTRPLHGLVNGVEPRWR